MHITKRPDYVTKIQYLCTKAHQRKLVFVQDLYLVKIGFAVAGKCILL